MSAGVSTARALAQDGEIWSWSHGLRPDDRLRDLGDIAAIDAGSGILCGMSRSGLAGCDPDFGAWREPDVLAIATDRAWDLRTNHRYCLLRANGSLLCGALDLNRASRPSPVPELGSDIRTMSIAEEGSCVLKADGAVWCAGIVAPGSMRKNYPPAPWTEVKGLGPGVVQLQVARGGHTACVVKNDGTVWCWGETILWFPNGSPNDRDFQELPIRIEALGSDVVNLALSYRWLAAVKRDGTVWYFGSDLIQLAGTFIVQSPELVKGLPSAAVEVSAGAGYLCALLVDDTAWCFGAGAKGLVGSSSVRNDVPSPLVGCE